MPTRDERQMLKKLRLQLKSDDFYLVLQAAKELVDRAENDKLDLSGDIKSFMAALKISYLPLQRICIQALNYVACYHCFPLDTIKQYLSSDTTSTIVMRDLLQTLALCHGVDIDSTKPYLLRLLRHQQYEIRLGAANLLRQLPGNPPLK